MDCGIGPQPSLRDSRPFGVHPSVELKRWAILDCPFGRGKHRTSVQTIRHQGPAARLVGNDPLREERVEVRASVSSNLIFGVGGFGQGRNPNKAPAARCLRFSDIGFDSSFVIRISSFGDTTWTRERPARLNESLITLRGGQWEHLDSNPKEVCGIPSQARPCRVEPGARESWPR